MVRKTDITPEDLLKPQNMLRLYSNGAFPMADEVNGEINWYMPEIRTIIPLEDYNYPRSLRKAIGKLNFEVRFDTDFESVIEGCASRSITWISPRLIEAYRGLLKLGNIHTVETWQNNNLVGGLYGVTYRGAFFGESMFSKVSEASKFALVKLLEHLNEKNFALLDVQYMTEHLKMFGAVEISFNEFIQFLDLAYSRDCEF